MDPVAWRACDGGDAVGSAVMRRVYPLHPPSPSLRDRLHRRTGNFGSPVLGAPISTEERGPEIFWDGIAAKDVQADADVRVVAVVRKAARGAG